MSTSRTLRPPSCLLILAGLAALLLASDCASRPAPIPTSSAQAHGLLAEDPPPAEDPPKEEDPSTTDPAPEDVKPPEEEVPPSPEPSPLGGDTLCSWGSNWDCNVCVANVPGQFAALRDHGEPLGFKHDGLELNVAYPSSNHIEGVQRLLTGQGRTFVISKRDDRSPGGQIALVVSMASRNGSGVRVRSNRLSTSIAQPEDTPPTTSDQVAATLPIFAGFKHGGGMQAAGNVVAIPMEEGPGNGRIALYDLNNSTAPQPFAVIEGTTPAAGTASLAKLRTNKWVLLLGHGDARKLEVF